MHSSRFLLTFFVLFFFGLQLKAYELKPVIIQLYYGEQPDTAGFNLVDKLPEFFYSNFKEGKLNLYDSPSKKIKITFETLQQIEQSNKSKASKIKTLFVHELWTLKKNKLDFFPVGITLTDFNEKGEVISYGYVDLEEAFSLLHSNHIATNANGPAYLSFWDAIKSHRYYYHIIQFGKQTVRNKAEGEKIKESNLQKGYNTPPAVEFAKSKLITYRVENTSENMEQNKTLIHKLELVFQNHSNLFDSCGLPASFAQNATPVEAILIKEVWGEKGGFFEYTPISVTAFFTGGKTCELKFNGIDFTDFKIFENDITSKLFNLTIISINSQPIKPADSPAYIFGMRSNEISWTQLTTYVNQKTK